MKTIRVRRSRPSIPALALALALTMLFVYAVSMPARRNANARDASAQIRNSMDVRMEGMEVDFLYSECCSDLLQARISAAGCAQNGGAGLILSDGSEYLVVREAVSNSAEENSFRRRANGLTLQISGSAWEVAAICDTVDFLRTQAAETGGLAAALESGDSDANSVCALLNVYRTRGQRSLNALEKIEGGPAVLERLKSAASACLERLDAGMEVIDAGKLRLIYAAACGEWIALLEELTVLGNA